VSKKKWLGGENGGTERDGSCESLVRPATGSAELRRFGVPLTRQPRGPRLSSAVDRAGTAESDRGKVLRDKLRDDWIERNKVPA